MSDFPIEQEEEETDLEHTFMSLRQKLAHVSFHFDRYHCQYWLTDFILL